MANITNTLGEGVDPSAGSNQMTHTAYGEVNYGGGNAPTNSEKQQGTGYDSHQQVSTDFGKYPIQYDPVTGAALQTTTGYSFPGHDLNAVVAGRVVGSDIGGMTDISIPAIGHATLLADNKKREEERKQ